MFNLPFLRKNALEKERYIFMLYLSGEKIYGFGFDESSPENQSSIYQEHVDPFLKDAEVVVGKIINNCERDLGENVYLKRTVLILNSLYTTESGAIREDFLQQIKKLLKDVDLENLGYLSFNEIVLGNFSKNQNYYFLEESLYDLTLYLIENGAIKKTDKVAKSEQLLESVTEVLKLQKEKYDLVTILYKKPEKILEKAKVIISVNDLPKLFTHVYFKDKKITNSQEIVPEGNEETEKETDLPMAPGFSKPLVKEEEEVSNTYFPEPVYSTSSKKLAKKWDFKGFFNFKIPNLGKKAYILVGLIFVLLLSTVYFLFLYKAQVILETKKENFSANIEFTLQEGNKYVKEYQNEIEVTSSGVTTGEKVTGEKAKGEITVYNGMFEKKELESGARFITNKGEEFAISDDLLVPAATTSADLDQGLETKAYGKKTIDVVAVSIGAEGNIDSGTKLSYSDLNGDDFYALANSNFNGGVKKTVAIFSQEDQKALDKKALLMAKNKLTNNFRESYDSTDILFKDTLSATNVKKSYSTEVGDEIPRATLNYRARLSAFYVPYNQLVEMVEKKELKDREFVDNSLKLTKIKLLNDKTNNYRYSAIAIGKVQNFIDKKLLLQRIQFKPVFKAKQILTDERNIIDVDIKTLPISLPIMPVFKKSINLEFVK